MPGLSGLVASNLGRTYGVSPGSASYGYLSRRMKSAGATNPYGIPTDFPLPPEAYPRGVPPPGYTTYTGPTGSAEVPNDSLPPAATGVRPGPAYPDNTMMGDYRPEPYMGDPGAKINDDMDPTHGMGVIPGGIDILGSYPNEGVPGSPEVRRALPVDDWLGVATNTGAPNPSNSDPTTVADQGNSIPGYGYGPGQAQPPFSFMSPVQRAARNKSFWLSTNLSPTMNWAGGRAGTSGSFWDSSGQGTSGPAFGMSNWATNPRSGEGYDLAGRQQGRHNIGALAARFGMAGVRGGRSGAGSGRMPGTFQ